MFKIICLLSVILSTALFIEGNEYETIYGGEQGQECLIYKGYNRYENSLRFKNQCDYKVEAKVCLEYTDGSKEVRESRRTIPKRGNWKFSADFSKTPRNVHWSSAPFNAQVPAPCR